MISDLLKILVILYIILCLSEVLPFNFLIALKQLNK